MSFSYVFLALFSSVAAYRPSKGMVALQVESTATQYMTNYTVAENTPSQSLASHASDKARNETFRGGQHRLGFTLPGSIMTIYNGLADLKAILEETALRKQTIHTNLAFDEMSLLDSLVTVHDTLVEKLDLRSNWSEVLEENIQIRSLKRKFTTAVFESDREACISDLTRSIANMRKSIVDLDKSADNLIEELKAAKPKRLPFPRYKDRSCEGDCRGEGCHDASAALIMKGQLSSFGSGISGEKAGYEGLCRELPDTIEASGAVTQCEEQCMEMGRCRGFEFYDGKIPHFSGSVYSNVSGSLIGQYHSWRGSTPNMTNRIPDVLDHVWVWKNNRWKEFRTCGNKVVVLAPEELPCTDPRCVEKKKLYKSICVTQSVTCRRCEAGRLPLQCGHKFLGCWSEKSVYLQAKPTSIESSRNRCCFKTSVANAHPQEYSNCMVKTLPDSLRSLEPQELAHVFERLSSSHSGDLKKDLEQASSLIESQQINGLALSAMGQVKIKQYLKISTPSNLRKITCMIHALKVGSTPQKCSDDLFMEVWGKVHTFVDPAVFWYLKFEKGPSWWAVSAANRAVSNMRHYNLISQATYDRASDYVDGSTFANDAYICVGKLIDLGTAAFAIHTAAFNPLLLASAVIWLVKQAAVRSWDHCWKVRNWLSKVNVANSVKSDAVIKAAFTTMTGDPPLDDRCLDEDKCESEMVVPEMELEAGAVDSVEDFLKP